MGTRWNKNDGMKKLELLGKKNVFFFLTIKNGGLT